MIKYFSSIRKIKKEAMFNKYNSYFYCLDFNYGLKDVFKYVEKQKCPKLSFLFYRDIKKCSKSKMKKIIFSDPKYLLKFALEIDSQYLNFAEKRIIKARDANSCLKLLKSKKYKNEKKLIDIVLKEGKPRQLISLAIFYKNNKNIIFSIQRKLMKLNSFKYLAYFMKKFNYLNTKKIDKFVRTSGEVSDVLFFAEKVKRSKLKELMIFI